MRSMMTPYPEGTAIFTPPVLRCSAATPATSMALMRSTNAGGNDSSIPYSTPILVMQPPLRPAARPACGPRPPVLPKKLLRHAVPPGPVMPEPLPHIENVGNPFCTQHVRQLY